MQLIINKRRPSIVAGPRLDAGQISSACLIVARATVRGNTVCTMRNVKYDQANMKIKYHVKYDQANMKIKYHKLSNRLKNSLKNPKNICHLSQETRITCVVLL